MPVAVGRLVPAVASILPLAALVTSPVKVAPLFIVTQLMVAPLVNGVAGLVAAHGAAADRSTPTVIASTEVVASNVRRSPCFIVDAQPYDGGRGALRARGRQSQVTVGYHRRKSQQRALAPTGRIFRPVAGRQHLVCPPGSS